MFREKIQKSPRKIVRLSSDICVTVITTCRPTDNAYADNKMDVGIGVLFQAFIYRVYLATISLVKQSFLRVKHLPLFAATDFLRRKSAPRGILISNCKKRIADERYAISHRELIRVCNVFVSRDFAKDYYRNRRAMPNDRKERVNRAQSSLSLKRRDNRK